MSDSVRVGKGHIEITPKLSGSFDGDLSKSLATSKGSDKAADLIGRRMSANITNGLVGDLRGSTVGNIIGRSLAQSNRSTAAPSRSIGNSIGQHLTAGVRVGFRGADVGRHVYQQLNQATFGAQDAGRTIGQRLTDGAGAALRLGDRGIGGSLRQAVTSGVGSALGPAVSAGQQLGQRFGISFGSVAAVGARAGLAAVITDLAGLGAQLAAAVAPAVGALLAIPAAGVAAAQGLGVLKAAFAGVGGALQAYSQQQAGAAGAANAAASAADAVISAQEHLAQATTQATQANVTAQRDYRQALQEEANAQRDLAEARKSAARQLEDLHTQVERGSLDEASARLQVEEAQKALTKATKAGSSATADQRAEARIALAEAKNGLQDTLTQNQRNAQDYAQQSKAGVKGSSAVISAQQRLAAAQQAVGDSTKNITTTQKNGLQQIADAQRSLAGALRSQAAAGAGAANAYAIALAKLPAPTQAFVRQLVAWKPLMNQLQSSAAGLFPGLLKGARDLVTNFPVVNAATAQTAAGLGRVAVNAGKAFSGPAFRKELGGILTSNARTTEQWGNSAVSLGRGLFDVVAAGAPIIEQQSRLGANLANNVRQYLAAKLASGQLQAFIQKGVDVSKQLFRILGNVGIALFNVFRAAPTGGVLDYVEKLTARLRNLTGSASGQNRIAGFFRIVDVAAYRAQLAVASLWQGFRSGQSNASGVYGIFSRLGVVLHNLVVRAQHVAPLVRGIVSVFLAALAPVRAFSTALHATGGKPGDGIDRLRTQLAPAFANLKTFFTALTPIARQFGATLRPILGTVAHLVGGVLLTGFRLFAAFLAHVVTPVLNAFSRQSGGTRSTLLAVAAGVFLLARSFGTLRQLRVLFVGLRAAIVLFRGGNPLQGIILGVRTLARFAFNMNPLVRAFRGLLGVIRFIRNPLAGVTRAFQLLRTAFLALRAAALANPFVAIVAGLILLGIVLVIAYKRSATFRRIVNAAFADVRQFVTATLRALVALFRLQFDVIVGIVRVAFFLLLTPVRVGLAVLRQIGRAGLALLRGDWSGAWDAIRVIPEKVLGAVQGSLSSAFGALRGLFRSAVRDLGSIWSGLREALSVPVRFFVNTVYNDGIRRAWNDTASKIGLGTLPAESIRGLRSGGAVSGPGGPREDKAGLYALSNGEYVQPADATAYYGTTLMSLLRAKAIPKELLGGLIHGVTHPGAVIAHAGRGLAAKALSALFSPIRSAIHSTLGTGDTWKGVVGGVALAPLDGLVNAVAGKADGGPIGPAMGAASSGGLSVTARLAGGGPVAGGRSGPLVSIGTFVTKDRTDVDLLARKLDYAARKGGF